MAYIYGLLALAAGLAAYYIITLRRKLSDTQATLTVQKAISDNRAVRMRVLEAQLKRDRDAKKEKDDEEAKKAAGDPAAASEYLRNS